MRQSARNTGTPARLHWNDESDHRIVRDPRGSRSYDAFRAMSATSRAALLDTYKLAGSRPRAVIRAIATAQD